MIKLIEELRMEIVNLVVGVQVSPPTPKNPLCVQIPERIYKHQYPRNLKPRFESTSRVIRLKAL